MKILVVEDEHKIARAIEQGLTQEHHVVDIAYDGMQGYDLAFAEEYDVIILDILLPAMDGLQICQKLRAEGNHTPILLLTAKGQVEDKVAGFTSGADDYLTKPFAFEELLARIQALARRPKTIISETLSYEDLTVHTEKFLVERRGKGIELSAKEFALLEYMLRHKGNVLTREQIIRHVWNYDASILPNTVEVFIGYLRNKIDKAFPKYKPLIKTVRGFGYKIGE